MTERECIYLMCRMQTIGPVYFERLLAYYGTAERAWRDDNPPLPGRTLTEWKKFHEKKVEIFYCRELARLSDKHCRFLIREDEDFPKAFHMLADCPVGIFLKGRLPSPEKAAVALIGARKCTEYGKSAALRFGKELGERDIPVISGMALGIDSWGQWGTLQAGGTSVAVLGSGIDVCYPTANRRLYEQLAERGAILSEYGPGEAGLPFHFPLRNRLISALSQVILVIEARKRSGSLITVDAALEQGKDVLAMPGRITDPLSEGCHHLIRQGAGILTDIDDVCRALGLEEKREVAGKRTLRLTDKQKAVYELLKCGPKHQDELASRTGLSISELLVILWELSEAGLCRQCSGGTYTGEA